MVHWVCQKSPDAPQNLCRCLPRSRNKLAKAVQIGATPVALSYNHSTLLKLPKHSLTDPISTFHPKLHPALAPGEDFTM